MRINIFYKLTGYNWNKVLYVKKSEIEKLKNWKIYILVKTSFKLKAILVLKIKKLRFFINLLVFRDFLD